MVNNKKNLFQQMFGLVKFHIFSFFFFRFFRVIIKKYIRRINSSLFFHTEHRMQNILLYFHSFINIKINLLFSYLNSFLLKYTGYTFFQYSDAFSVSTLFLIIIKLCFRLFGYNLHWKINLSLLFLGTLICLALDIATPLRKLIKRIWRSLLPSSFYFKRTCIDKNGNDFSFDYYETFNYSELSFLRKALLNLFYVLIYIRLCIFSETYLFIIFNYFFIYFLISNQFLITSSIIGLLLAASRWTFFLQEKTFSEFKSRFTGVVIIKEGETLYPSWENTITVALFITRYLNENFAYVIDNDPKYQQEYELSGAEDPHGIAFYLAEKYKELKHPLLEKVKYLTYTYTGFAKDEKRPKYEEYEEYLLGIRAAVSEYYRSGKVYETFGIKNDWLEREYGKEVVVIFEKLQENLFTLKRRNSYFYFALIGLIILLFSYILLWNNWENVNELSGNPANTPPVIKTIKEMLDKSFTAIRKVTDTIVIPKEHSPQELEKITKKPLPELFDSTKAANHSIVLERTDNGTVGVFTKSHIRSAKKDPSLRKLPTEPKENYPIQGLVVNTKDHEIKDEKACKEIFEKYPKPALAITNVLNNFPSFVRSEKVIKGYTTQMSSTERGRFFQDIKNFPNKLRTEHETFTMIHYIAFDATASFNDSYQAIHLGLNYSLLISAHKHTNGLQREQYFLKAELYIKHRTTFEQYGKNNSSYQVQDNPHFQEIFRQGHAIIEHHGKQSKENPFISEPKFLSERNNETMETTRSKYTNNEHLPTEE